MMRASRPPRGEPARAKGRFLPFALALASLILALLIVALDALVYLYAVSPAARQQHALSRSTPSGNVSSFANPIQQENALAGTTDWQITRGSEHGEIQAYAGEDSINRGGTVHLYVSTTAPMYSVQIFRLGYYGGAGGRLVATLPAAPGISQGYYPNSNIDQLKARAPLNCPTCVISLKDSRGTETDLTDANWRLSQAIPFSASWISGIYLLKLTESSQGYQWDVPVVVRDDAAMAAIIYQDPVNTDQAYNLWGGANAYSDYRRGSRWGYYLSFNRPYSLDYGAGELFNWTYPMVRFLEQHGYDVRYTTNNAVAEGETTLLNYQTFLDAGHDEYWSAAERQKLEAAIAKGINVAFFGANDIYWQIRTIPDSSNRPDRIIVIYKDIHLPYLDPEHGTPTDTVRWRDPGVRDPEDKILKAMFGFDNVTRLGSNNGSLLQNLVVTDTSSWVFAGSGLKNGDTIKEILGTEVDTIYRDGSITANDTITIIGQSPYISTGGEHWVGFAVLDQLKSTNNWIFDAGTMYWPEALSNFACHSQPLCPPESPALERITQNILDRMTNSSS